MKKCPNCGALMEADVNFCTSCGADLRQVPAQENENQKPAEKQSAPTQQPQQTQQAAPVQQPTQSAPTNQSASVQNTGMRRTEVQQQPAAPSGFSLYWEWLVASWKTPSADLAKEKWYGIVDLAFEILLFSIACWEMMQKGVSSVTSGIGSLIPQVSSYASQQVQNVGVQLFFALIISSLVMIIGAWVTRIFLFQDKVSFVDQLNEIGQASNYNMILSVVIFILAFIGGANNFIAFLAFAMNLVFLASVISSGMGNKPAKRDRLFGALILLVIILVATFIFIGMAANTLKSLGF
ncbi:zinc ribbon domain-containing protein [Lactobacillus hominis]|nr:zinc ribbon domain-containing protein [Lactobacillus hominis]KRM84777.1 hypothetical protein FC41_GL000503 [Lactobacillus hominis DSM 23910 = CRBIP 24.179]